MERLHKRRGMNFWIPLIVGAGLLALLGAWMSNFPW